MWLKNNETDERERLAYKLKLYVDKKRAFCGPEESSKTLFLKHCKS